MKKVGVYLIILVTIITGCTKVEKKLSQETSPPDEKKILDKVETPSTVNIPNKIENYINKMTIEEKIGQLLMPAFRDFNYNDPVDYMSEPMEKALEEYKVGGVILFKENIKDKKQVQLLVKDLQRKSEIPLFMGVDEEGGIVSRISSNPEMGFDEIDTAYEIGQQGDKAKAYDTGLQLGLMLRQLGFNMNFAPVADIWSNPDNTVIGERSFGNDPEIVSKMVNEVVQGLQDEEIISVIKHFPGHGDTKEDTHEGSAFVDASLDQLKDRELIPFKNAIDSGVTGVMVGHVELPQIDQGVPSTLSSKIITDILKKDMEFEGLIITDALDMGAMTDEFGEGEVALKSFLAGTDILLMPNLEKAHSSLMQAYEDKKITDQRLDESVYKILYTKYEYGIIDDDFFTR